MSAAKTRTGAGAASGTRRRTRGAGAPPPGKGSAAAGPRPVRDSFVRFVLDQLSRLDGVRAKSMFGGHGLYRDEVFFGIVFSGRLYFKVSDATRHKYEERGAKPFRPGAKQTLKRYYEVPLEVTEDPAELARWAREASAEPTI